MQIAIIYSRARIGIDAPLITIEVHLSGGLPAFHIVGLPETSVRESRDRVRSALINARFDFPASRITINLAPADLPKEGSRFDLAIALGILAASRQVPPDKLADHEFIGELGLTGELRGVEAALPAAIQCDTAGRKLMLPADNAGAARRFVPDALVPVSSLLDAAAYLAGAEREAPSIAPAPALEENGLADFADIVGQHSAKRALEIAAGGGHNLLLSGPPGTGKTLMASRLPSILPPLDREEMLETCSIYSVAGKPAYRETRPFRSPHHTASAVALVGGGNRARPGEVSLAHGGVLFLDELPEYPRKVLEVLREPLEAGEIFIARANINVRYPARFQLIAAMNPCPCGYHDDPQHECRCTPDQILRYKSRISGPLLDRIDLFVDVPRLPPGSLQSGNGGESSATIRARVLAARSRQQARGGTVNARLDLAAVKRDCRLCDTGQELLLRAEARLGLSPRAQHRVMKVARTIADLQGAAEIGPDHLGEALAYRGD